MVFQTLADKHGGLKKFSPTGTSVMVQGEIKATPEGVKQVWNINSCVSDTCHACTNTTGGVSSSSSSSSSVRFGSRRIRLIILSKL